MVAEVVFGAVVTAGVVAEVVAGPATAPVAGEPSTERAQPATTTAAAAKRRTARTV
ncbi:hypothetical protein Rhow_000092 [Rhodococcus wratislaviensis]|uniref:Uncharacterized protein n=1 Tax=Rhodococcus wratislaviensis TaxID=44752 RepID=A0A402BXN5_RHOWR|nr:hypothetical protein Rhow_000092 [Rhodococcus wratislaviensis]